MGKMGVDFGFNCVGRSLSMNLSKTILLVEDDPDDVFIFKRALKAARIVNPLAEVANGQEAIHYLTHQGKYSDRERHPLPFVMFLDLKMPYIDGFEVLSWMRQQQSLQSIVVVVLTGSNEMRDHKKAYTLGARSYLVKPPAAKEITQFINSMVSYWGPLGESSPVCIESE